MPRQLIFVTDPERRIVGTERIDARYTKGYTEADMRGWAADFDRWRAMSPAERERLSATPRERLTPDEQRILAVRDALVTEHERGIKGCLLYTSPSPRD